MSTFFRWPLRAFPVIRFSGRVPFSRAESQWGYFHATCALHQHYYHGRMTIGRRVFDLRPGDLTLSPPFTRSRYDLREDGHHWCIHFQPEKGPARATSFPLPLYLPMHGGGGQATERFRFIVDVLNARHRSAAAREMAGTAASIALQELLLMLSLEARERRPTRPYQRKSDGLLDAAREQIDRDYRQPLAVADLARGSGLSRNYFSARFRERFGLTVDAYLLQRRLEMAKLLLHSTTRPIKEIAFECGIPDPGYFNKQFRRATGASPTAFRERAEKVW